VTTGGIWGEHIVFNFVVVFSLFLTVFSKTSIAQVQSVEITCSSESYKKAICSANRGRIESVQLLKRISRSECTEGVSFGVQGGRLWVDVGCRAKFSARVDLSKTPDPLDQNSDASHPQTGSAFWPNLNYPAEKTGQLVGKIFGADAPLQHGTAFVIKGHLVVPFADNVRNGGFSFYDLSQPASPRFVSQIRHPEMREGHAVGLMVSDDRIFVAGLGSYGVLFFEFTNPRQPEFLGKIDLEDIEPSDYDNGAWWLSWQSKYLYVAGSSRGLYVLDTSDLKHSKLIKRLTVRETGGFRVGSVFAFGNLLTITGNDVAGKSIFDISEPWNPKLIHTDTDERSYSSMLYDNKLLLAGAGNWLGGNGLIVYDISNPSRPVKLSSHSTSDKGGYLTVQDSVAHMGSSDGYYKIDFTNPSSPKRLLKSSFGSSGADLDFVSVLGNLAVFGDDHGLGTRIAVHQSTPDNLGPSLTNGISPKPNSTNQSIHSRIGLSFSDALDVSTVNSRNIKLVNLKNSKPVEVLLSYQTGLVQVVPVQPLSEKTRYEVLVLSGLKDVAGNPMKNSRKFEFTTGIHDQSHALSACQFETLKPENQGTVMVGDQVNLALKGCLLGDGGIDLNKLTVSIDLGLGEGFQIVKISQSGVLSFVLNQSGQYKIQLKLNYQQQNQILSLTQTVVNIPLSGRGLSSKSLVHDVSTNSFWTVNTDAGTVSKVHPQAATLEKEIYVGERPQSLALDENGLLWVTVQGEDKVVALHSTTGQQLFEFKLGYGSLPAGVVASSRLGSVFVTGEGSSKIYELALGQLGIELKSEIPIQDPRGFSVETRRVDIRNLAIDPLQNFLYVNRFRSPEDQGEIYVVDLRTRNQSAVILLDYDHNQDTESQGSGVPNYLSGLELSPDGRWLYVTAKKDNVKRGLYRSGVKLSFENTVRTIVMRISTITMKEDKKWRVDLNDRNLAFDIATSPLGDFLFVTTLGSQTVDILNAFSGEVVSSIENLGHAPQAVFFDQTRNQLWVHNSLDRELVAFSLEELGRRNVFKKTYSLRLVQKETLGPQVLWGKKIFLNSNDPRMSRDKYLSCASCHFDGDSDNRVWDFTERGEGLRNTTTLEGKSGTGHGFLHWSANFDEIQDFEHDIRGGFGGTGFLDHKYMNENMTGLGTPKVGLSPELDALSAYVSSLSSAPKSPFREQNGEWTLGAKRGGEVFNRMACMECHAGSDFTDSPQGRRHDVGTIEISSGQRMGLGRLDGLDTPTLLGIWKTPPYLHDGSAKTIREVLVEKNKNGKHGHTQTLSEQELNDLIDYLRQL
jgi:hypothetical protein